MWLLSGACNVRIGFRISRGGGGGGRIGVYVKSYNALEDSEVKRIWPVLKVQHRTTKLHRVSQPFVHIPVGLHYRRIL